MCHGCGLAGRNSRNTFVMAGKGPAVVWMGRLRLTVRYGDESYFFNGWAHTKLTGRWRALSPRYFLLLSCWPSGFPNNAMRMTQVRWSAPELLRSGSRYSQINMAKERERMYFIYKNQWKFPEWAQEKASRENLGGSIQQDSYWSKDQDKRPGPYLRGAGRWHHATSLWGARHLPDVRWRGLRHSPGNHHLHPQTTVPILCALTASQTNVTKAVSLGNITGAERLQGRPVTHVKRNDWQWQIQDFSQGEASTPKEVRY